MDGVEEQSALFYVMGFLNKQDKEKTIDWGVIEGLVLKPLVVQRGECVEMVCVSKQYRTENEWSAWLRDNDHIKQHLHVQTSCMVSMGDDGEACVSRLLEKGVVNDREHEFEVFRLASGGKMYYLDQREWCMRASDVHELRQRRLGLRVAIEQTWQRRFNLSVEIDAVRDVLGLVEKLTPYRISDQGGGAAYYSISSSATPHDGKMMMQFTPLFDWFDLRVLEDREAETLGEIDALTCKLQRTDVVIERQRALSGIQGCSRKRVRVLSE